MKQYYLNNDQENSSCCSKGEGLENHLNKSNYLSEFTTPEDKELVRDNLGISDIVSLLKNRIDRKVINSGAIAWDDVPTEGNIDKALSSDAIYRTLLNYLKTADFDAAWRQLESDVEQYGETQQEALTTFREEISDLQQFVEEEYNNLYNTLYDNLYRDKITKLEAKIKQLEILVKSFLKTKDTGQAFSNEFGNDDFIGVNQKTLTKTINKIWNKLSEISGEGYQGILLEITPEYFYGEQTIVHITASTEHTNDIFERLEIYLDGELITEVKNVEHFEYDLPVTKTSVLMCKAQILGIEYTEQKTITHYHSFWMGAGQDYIDVMNTYNVVNLDESKNYNKVFNPDDYLIIVTNENFIRADMNGLEIPFDEPYEINVDDTVYRVYKSKNTYKQGTYNIDINS